MEKGYKKLRKKEMQRVGDKIKLFRVKENLNQREFAEKLNLSQTQITNAEQGKSQKAQDKVIYHLKEEYKLPENYFVDKVADAKLLMDALANMDIEDPDALIALLKETRHQVRHQIKVDSQTTEPTHTAAGIPLVPLTATKRPKVDDITKGKYIAIVEGSIAKVVQLKDYLDQTKEKDLDKDLLTKIVNDVFVILSIKDEIS